MKFFFQILYLMGCVLLLVGCANKQDTRPKRDCPIDRLLLSQSDYPSDTIFNDISMPMAEMPLESAGRSVNYMGDSVFQEVARFFSIENAIAEYDKVKKIVFHPNQVAGVWEFPLTAELNNLSADSHTIACGNVVSFGKRCYMIGQYEDYYVFFRADISAKGCGRRSFQWEWLR